MVEDVLYEDSTGMGCVGLDILTHKRTLGQGVELLRNEGSAAVMSAGDVQA